MGWYPPVLSSLYISRSVSFGLKNERKCTKKCPDEVMCQHHARKKKKKIIFIHQCFSTNTGNLLFRRLKNKQNHSDYSISCYVMPVIIIFMLTCKVSLIIVPALWSVIVPPWSVRSGGRRQGHLDNTVPLTWRKFGAEMSASDGSPCTNPNPAFSLQCSLEAPLLVTDPPNTP